MKRRMTYAVMMIGALALAGCDSRDAGNSGEAGAGNGEPAGGPGGAAPPAPTPPPPPEVRTPFKLSAPLQAVTAHLGEGGAHYSVTHLEGDAENLGRLLDDLLTSVRDQVGEDFPAGLSVENLVRELGVHHVTAMGQSAHQVGVRWHNRIFLSTGGRRVGVLSLLGDEAKDFVAPTFAPANADLVLEASLSLKQIRDVARKIAASFGPEASQGLGEALGEKLLEGSLTLGDFLGKFDVRVSLAATLDPAHVIPLSDQISVPGVMVVGRIDGGKWMWDAYGKTLAEDSKTLTKNGLEMMMAPEPIETPMGAVQPVLALEESSGSIWFALREEDLEAARAAGGERLAGSEAFKSAMTGLPPQGNVLFYSSQRLMTELRKLIETGLASVEADAAAGLGMLSLFLPMLQGEPSAYAGVIANNADGVLLALNGPSPIKGKSLMGSSGTVVALAALATPQIFKALKRAELAENLNNARQVKLVLDAHAADFDGKYPPSLQALVDGELLPPDAEILTMKCEDGEMRQWGYVPGLENTEDPNRVILYGPEPSDGKRILVRVDGSARIIPEDEFQQLLLEQKIGLE